MQAQQEYWNLVLSSLEISIPPTHFNAWFSRLCFVSTKNTGTIIVVSTFSRFAQKYIEDKYKNQLLEVINRYYPKVNSLEFIIDGSNNTGHKSTQNKPAATQVDQNQAIEFQSGNLGIQPKSIPAPIKLLKSNLNNLNPKYTFDTLVSNRSNELATCVAKIISEKPGTQYNPVFLYSGTGLGKTHTLQAIGQKTLELHPNFNIKYITSETFVNHYIESVTGRKMKDFNEFYRSVDLLLVDDIHFIAGKEGTQEAFFHIFNILHQHNKQIVVSSDKHPKNLGGMEERLISRFEWGIVIDLSKPDMEDRLGVIRFKVKSMNIKLTDLQMELIARQVDTNYRDIEGVLNRVQARQQLLPNNAISEAELTQILQGFNLTSLIKIDFKPRVTSARQIIDLVANALCIDSDKIMGKNREKKIALARQLTMYILYKDLNYNYTAISSVFAKSHSTVIHAVDKIKQDLIINCEVSNYLNLIRQNYPK
jgi:chromosomal replication initiator protein